MAVSVRPGAPVGGMPGPTWAVVGSLGGAPDRDDDDYLF